MISFFVIEQNVKCPKNGRLEPRGLYSFWNRWVNLDFQNLRNGGIFICLSNWKNSYLFRAEKSREINPYKMLISKPLKTGDFLKPITLNNQIFVDKFRKKSKSSNKTIFLKNLEKNYFWKNFKKNSFEKILSFVFKNPLKSSRHEKRKKNFRSNRPSLISAHWSAFSSSDWRLAVFDRKFMAAILIVSS